MVQGNLRSSSDRVPREVGRGLDRVALGPLEDSALQMLESAIPYLRYIFPKHHMLAEKPQAKFGSEFTFGFDYRRELTKELMQAG